MQQDSQCEDNLRRVAVPCVLVIGWIYHYSHSLLSVAVGIMAP